MWRPEDWENEFSKAWDETRYNDFEAGADAMLEALLNGHKLFSTTINEGIKSPYLPKEDGIWVFIPDEKEVK